MDRRMREPYHPLLRALVRAALGIAAFGFACGVFLALPKRLGFLPPTDPIAVGRVTLEGASKLREYILGGTFFVVVPILTIALQRLWDAALTRIVRPISDRRHEGPLAVASVLFALPLSLSPVFWVFTSKELWSMLFPLVMAGGGAGAVTFWQTASWFHELRRSSSTIHALVVTEAASWLVFRYLATGRMIAHIPTIMLEVPFLLLFTGAFWALTIALARGVSRITGQTTKRSFAGVAIALSPVVVLPIVGLLDSPTVVIGATVVVLSGILLVVTAFRPVAPDPVILRRCLVYLAIPLLLFVIDYASSASLSKWVDLFHRGESLGPASDYLRGKVPYLDVFPLHGLLDDGLLDAQLIRFWGRDSSIVLDRHVVISSFMLPVLWWLGWVLFQSMGLALATASIGLFIAGDNQRAVLEMLAIIMILLAIRRGRAGFLLPAGTFSALALFFSLETGLYCLAATLIGIPLVGFLSGNGARIPVGRWLGAFILGFLIGAAPFAGWLASLGALGEFFGVSFGVIPGIVDAVWSLPFPDLASDFRTNAGSMNLFDWAYRLRFLLNPTVVSLSVLLLILRARSGRTTAYERSLAIVVLFAIMTQRSALGRADISHQWFSAFLIAPLLVALLVEAGRWLGEIWSTRERGSQAWVAAIVVVSLPILVTLLFVPGLFGTTIHDLIRYRERTRPGWNDPRGLASTRRIEAIRAEIETLVPPDDPIYDFSNQPAFYFFTNRRNPTRFYQVPIVSFPPFQQEVIDDLRTDAPAVVIMTSPDQYDMFDEIPNQTRAPQVASFIRRYYEPWKIVQGVELWRPRKPEGIPLDEPGTQPDGVLGPSTSGVVEREVFPVAGSLPGASESWWQSDLTLHNPHDQTLDLRLLFLTAEWARDRRFPVAAHGTMHIPDVIGWMGAKGTRGPLWIEYPQGLQPVARLTTRDIHRSGLPLLQDPMTRADSATANGRPAFLVLLGPAEPDRTRLNLGIVNTGDEPATIRLGIFDAQGRRIGGSAEILIEPRNAWYVSDLRRTYDVQIDATSTIRIDVIAGSVAAAGTLVNGETGDQYPVRAVPSGQ